MPNWIKGSLKLRGSYENILKFYKEGLNIYEFSVINEDGKALDKSIWLEIEEYKNKNKRTASIYISASNASGGWAYVEGTKRAFILSEQIDIYIFERDDRPTISVSEVAQAWGFKEEDWLEIAKKYNVDIHLYGYECGMQFGQEIEIVNGQIVKDETMHYDDWEWDCPFPWMGG